MNMRKIIAVLAAMLLLCAAIPMAAISVSAAADAVLSLDFEDGKATLANAVICDTQVGSGSKSIQLDCSTTNYAQVYTYLNLKANTDYVVNFKAYSTKTAGLSVYLLNTSWGSIMKASVNVHNNNWAEYTVTVNPGDNTTVVFGLQSAWAANSGLVYYFDDITVIEKSAYKPSYDGGDAVLDKDFEDGNAAFSNAVISNEAANGSNSIALDCGAANYAQVYTYLKLTANTDYIVSFKAKASSNNIGISVNFLNSSWGGIMTKKVSLSQEWVEYTVLMNPGDNTTVVFGLQCGWSATSGLTCYFDDVIVTTIPAPEAPKAIYSEDFEGGALNGWSSSNSSVATDMPVSNGSANAMKFVSTNYSYTNYKLTVEKNTTYRVQYSLLSGEASRPLNVRVRTGGSVDLAYNQHAGSTTAWQTFTMIFNSGNETSLNFRFQSAHTTCTYYIDNLSVTPVDVEQKDDGFLKNGDFETGMADNWDYTPSTSYVENPDGEGYVLKTNEAAQANMLAQPINIVEGKEYVVYFKVYGYSTASNSAIYLRLGAPANTTWDISAIKTNMAGVGNDMSDKWTRQVRLNMNSNTGKWCYAAVPFTAAKTTSINVSIYNYRANEGKYYFDDFVVFEKKAASNDGFIKNGDFETGTAEGLSVSGQTVVSPSAAKDGNFGLHMKNQSGGWGGVGQWAIAGLEIGATYKLEMDMKAISKGFNWTLWQGAYNSGNKYASGYYSTADWTHIEKEFVANEATAVLNINGGNAGVSEDVYLDNLKLTKIKDAHTHSYVGAVTKEPTCNEEGVKTYTCSCGDSYTEAIPVLASVAAIGDVKYASLADALADAANGEIVLLANIELDAPIVIAAGQTVTLDLNGFEIVYNNTIQGEAMISNHGTLTINDSVGSGVINYNYTGAADPSYGIGNYTISNGGYLTVNGGKITIANLSGHAKYPINNNSGTGDAILVINGGHLYNYNTSAIRMFCNTTTYKNSVTINGGLIEGYCAIWVQNPGKNTVNAQLSITGGEIKTTAKAYVNGTADLKDVSSAIYCTINGEGGAWDENSLISITGGEINENVYLADSAPANLNVEGEAIFNGYVELPASNAVASINGVEYASLEEAIAAAQPGDVIVLLADITADAPIVIADGQNIVLDLNGKTISRVNAETLTKNDALIRITKGGELTVIDSIGGGKIVYEYTGEATGWGGYSATTIENNQGTLTVKSGEIISNTNMANQIAYAINTLTNGNIGDATTNIEGGKIVAAGSTALRQFANSTTCTNTMNITGGEIIGRVQLQSSSKNDNKGVLNITGGTITREGNTAIEVWFAGGTSSAYANTYVSIGGDVVVKGNIVFDEAPADYDTSVISGGTFSYDVSEYCVDGFDCTANDDGTFGVAEHVPNYVAAIGEEKYESLAEAIAAAKSGDVIVLLADIDTDATYTIADGLSITLDLNGKTITATDKKTVNYELFYIYGEMTVTGNGNITLTAENDRDWNAMSAIFHNRGGVLVIENGNYTHNGGTDMAYVVDNSGNSYGDAVTTIKGGTLTTTYRVVRNRMDTYGANGGGNGIPTLNIEGGILTGRVAVWAQVSSKGCKGEIYISGGTLISTDADKPALYIGTDDTGVIITEVSGGTFSSDVSEYCVDGFDCTANDDGTFGVALHVHNVIHVVAKAPTCTEMGNIEYWYCDACGYAWLDAECTLNTNLKAVVLPMAAHTYTDCDDATCDVCDFERVPSHNLTYVPAVVPANCLETGHDEYWECADCGAYFGDAEASYQVNPAWMYYTGDCVRPEGAADCATVPCALCGNDTYGDGEHDTGVPACQTGTCSKCNAEIAGYGCQNYTTPICQDGVCDYCGSFIAGLGHENGAWAACCDGECTYGCGLLYPATEDHVDSDADDYCDNCWNHLNHDVDPCIGGECSICWTYIEGAHTYFDACSPTCEVCGAEREVSHNIIHVEAKAPTCTENGNIEYWYCDKCGAAWLDAECTLNTNLKAVVLGATCATNAVHTAAKEATCFEHGNVEYWYCANCDVYYLDAACTIITNAKSVIIPITHNVIHVEAKAPTCTEPGNIEYWYCDICGSAWTDELLREVTNLKNVVLPIAHNIEYVAAKAASCYEPGNIEYWYCTECGSAWTDELLREVTNLKNVVLPIAHNIVYVAAKAPTCTEMGNIEHWYCDICGQAWLDELCHQNTNLKAVVLPMAEHTYDNDFDVDCNVCDAVREVAPLSPVFGGKSVRENSYGTGLAYKFDMTVNGIAVKKNTYNQIDYTNAYLDGYKLVKMGAIASNGKSTVDIPAVHMLSKDGEDISVAYRVINIPADKLDVVITMTPYYVILIDGVETTIYGEAVSGSYTEVVG